MPTFQKLAQTTTPAARFIILVNITKGTKNPRVESFFPKITARKETRSVQIREAVKKENGIF